MDRISSRLARPELSHYPVPTSPGIHGVTANPSHFPGPTHSAQGTTALRFLNFAIKILNKI